MNTLEVPTTRLLGWLTAALVANSVLPWVLRRGDKNAERQDLIDCNEPDQRPAHDGRAIVGS